VEFLTGSGAVTEEAWHRFRIFFFSEAHVQEVTQDVCWCEVADEPVVVMKAQPVKASNGVEDKTEQTTGMMFGGADSSQKRYELRRGEVVFKAHD
jgi:hypothetical protein